jgi:flagellar biosynthesis/type III secretory pathway ATPase
MLTFTKEEFFNCINGAIRQNINKYDDLNVNIRINISADKLSDESHKNITQWLSEYIDIMNEENKFVDVCWYDYSRDDEYSYAVEMTEKISTKMTYPKSISDETFSVESIEFDWD